jgi:hypothetical protein
LGLSGSKRQRALAPGVCFRQTVNLKAKQNQSFTGFIAEIASKILCQAKKSPKPNTINQIRIAQELFPTRYN